MIRIWAGYAVSAERFAISIGELRDEDPQSVILMYNARHEITWGYADLPRTIKSITAITDPTTGKPVFVPMSNEGDVYFLTGDIPVEKIEGAGVLSDDAEGYGAMSYITQDEGHLFACGYGSQVYDRRHPDDWLRICDNTLPHIDDSAFFGLACRPGRGPVAVCGQKRIKHNEPNAEQQAQIDQKIAAGDKKAAKALRAKFRTIRVAPTTSLYLRTASWQEVETGFSGGLNACVALPTGEILAVGDHGTIVRTTDGGQAEDMSSPGLNENLYSVAAWHQEVAILGELGIHVFDADLAFNRTIPFPNGLSLPNRMQVLGEDIILFDYAGIALFRAGGWQRIPIPEDMWNLATE